MSAWTIFGVALLLFNVACSAFFLLRVLHAEPINERAAWLSAFLFSASQAAQQALSLQGVTA